MPLRETLITIYLISTSVLIFGSIYFEEDMEEWLSDYGLNMKEFYIISFIPIINTTYAIFVFGDLLKEIHFYLVIFQIKMIINYVRIKIFFRKLFKIKV